MHLRSMRSRAPGENLTQGAGGQVQPDSLALLQDGSRLCLANVSRGQRPEVLSLFPTASGTVA